MIILPNNRALAGQMATYAEFTFPYDGKLLSASGYHTGGNSVEWRVSEVGGKIVATGNDPENVFAPYGEKGKWVLRMLEDLYGLIAIR